AGAADNHPSFADQSINRVSSPWAVSGCASEFGGDGFWPPASSRVLSSRLTGFGKGVGSRPLALLPVMIAGALPAGISYSVQLPPCSLSMRKPGGSAAGGGTGAATGVSIGTTTGDSTGGTTAGSTGAATGSISASCRARWWSSIQFKKL